MTNTSTFYVFDFDDVLFDTPAFVRELKSGLAPLGVNSEVFDVARKCLIDPYVPEKHMLELTKVIGGFDQQAALGVYDAVIKKSEQFVFVDARMLVSKLGVASSAICTYGYRPFQEAKVQASGMSALVSEVAYTDAGKHEQDHLFKHPNTVFIDNSAKHIEEVKTAFPHVRCLQLIREYNKKDQPSKMADAVITTLGSLKERS